MRGLSNDGLPRPVGSPPDTTTPPPTTPATQTQQTKKPDTTTKTQEAAKDVVVRSGADPAPAPSTPQGSGQPDLAQPSDGHVGKPAEQAAHLTPPPTAPTNLDDGLFAIYGSAAAPTTTAVTVNVAPPAVSAAKTNRILDALEKLPATVSVQDFLKRFQDAANREGVPLAAVLAPAFECFRKGTHDSNKANAGQNLSRALNVIEAARLKGCPFDDARAKLGALSRRAAQLGDDGLIQFVKDTLSRVGNLPAQPPAHVTSSATVSQPPRDNSVATFRCTEAVLAIANPAHASPQEFLSAIKDTATKHGIEAQSALDGVVRNLIAGASAEKERGGPTLWRAVKVVEAARLWDAALPDASARLAQILNRAQQLGDLDLMMAALGTHRQVGSLASDSLVDWSKLASSKSQAPMLDALQVRAKRIPTDQLATMYTYAHRQLSRASHSGLSADKHLLAKGLVMEAGKFLAERGLDVALHGAPLLVRVALSTAQSGAVAVLENKEAKEAAKHMLLAAVGTLVPEAEVAIYAAELAGYFKGGGVDNTCVAVLEKLRGSSSDVTLPQAVASVMSADPELKQLTGEAQARFIAHLCEGPLRAVLMHNTVRYLETLSN